MLEWVLSLTPCMFLPLAIALCITLFSMPDYALKSVNDYQSSQTIGAVTSILPVLGVIAIVVTAIMIVWYRHR